MDTYQDEVCRLIIDALNVAATDDNWHWNLIKHYIEWGDGLEAVTLNERNHILNRLDKIPNLKTADYLTIKAAFPEMDLSSLWSVLKASGRTWGKIADERDSPCF